jgi:hypothetical protein
MTTTPEPATGERVLPVLGRTLLTRGVTPRMAAWLDEHWLHPEHAPPPHPFRITLDRAAAREAPEPIQGDAVRVAVPGFEQSWRHRGGTWEWTGEEGTVRLELETTAATAGTPAGAADPAGAAHGARIEAWGLDPLGPDAAVALHTALCEALRASGLVPLHAAAAIPPAGATGATAFLGRSGAGKSTTLLRLMEAGWTPLAEDLSWIDPPTGTLYGWDRGVHLWPHTVAAFLPGLADAPWRAGADGKLFLAYSDLGVTGARSASLDRVALLLRAPDGDASWEPLEPRDCVRALWESTGVPLTPRGRAVQGAWIAAVARHTPGAALRLGPGRVPAGVGS